MQPGVTADQLGDPSCSAITIPLIEDIRLPALQVVIQK
jgi:hypothetical protein